MSSTPELVQPPVDQLPVTVYWRPGCPFCSSLLGGLRRSGIEFDQINIWDDPGAAGIVRRAARGNETVPTVRVGESFFVNPTAKAVVTAAGGPAQRPRPSRWFGRGRSRAVTTPDPAGTNRSGPTMMRAIWNGEVIAESDDTVIVEGNHYFPVKSVRADLLAPSPTTSVCPWKGTASYYTLQVAGRENRDAVWYYPTPKTAAASIEGRVAFWRGVTVESA